MGASSRLRLNAFNLLVVIFVAISTLSTAYGLAIIGSTAGQPNFYTYFDLAPQGDPGYAYTTNILGALNGANSGGALIGCIVTAWIADKISRKHTMQLGCVFIILGGALNAGAVNITMFAIGRAIAGLGAGMLAVVVPMYQGEVATAESRGAMMCVTGIMWAFGYTFAGWFGYGCAFIPGSSPHAPAAWRVPLAFQCVPPLVFLLGSPFIPYSPRWLLSKDRQSEAFNVILRLHARKEDPRSVQAREEFYLMEKQYEADKRLSLDRPFELFRTKANRRRAMISAMLMGFDQMIGTFVLTNYGVLIYASLGLEGKMPLLLNACWTTFTIFGNTWTALFIDKFGRRPFLLIGTTGCLVSLIFEAALTATYVDTNSNNQAALSAAVFFIWLFIFFWCFFLDATQFVYNSEIWPNHLRAAGSALGLAFFFLMSEVTLVAAPVALNSVGWKFYLVLICPTSVYIPIIYFLFPETKGRTLEEMGAIFGDENVATQWYGVSEDERRKIAENAMHMTADGKVVDEKSHEDVERKEEI